MHRVEDRERAAHPEDLNRLVLKRLNTADVDGLVALYEPGAVLALPGGRVAVGHHEIRAAYAQLVAGRPEFLPGTVNPAVRNGELAITSVRIGGGDFTVEVARRQADGTWLWVIDQPSLLS
ncbi:YybH family protein [Yinghuangia soli]|uniref:Nuclear transport factor 2 family protein n=1 Tax=Yinghuangia soli TaxID=2908204 RepID=A0AA41PTV1_9ACTN|nr:nuclear transport factor 2 family protein [Yinghuangia soli]MCF2525773.1 nuclear transport factor 2 family protein [Yinghuangia soli]